MSSKEENNITRRKFISQTLMTSGLAASYGTFAYMGAKFLYPSEDQPQQWVYVTTLRKIKVGESILYKSPIGQKIAIARHANKGDSNDFVALSSICPHLGCQVHWQANEQRFFCPCHNGAFSPDGKAIGGPPKDANQYLARYLLKVETGLLYIKVPIS